MQNDDAIKWILFLYAMQIWNILICHELHGQYIVVLRSMQHSLHI